MARGSSSIAGELAEYLEDKGMTHVRGAPLHPQSQGKIVRWHQTLKNRILVENYVPEGEQETALPHADLAVAAAGVAQGKAV